MKRALLAATAVVFSSLASTPAMAGHSTANPIIDTTGRTLQSICEEALRPADPSQFTTTPVETGSTGWVPTGLSRVGPAVSPEQRRKVGGALATGVTSVTNNPYRNGGSPNIWVEARADVTYAAEKLFETEFQQQSTVTFMCDVTKRVGNNDHLVDPHGLESYGHQSISTQWQLGSVADRQWVADGTIVEIGQTVYVLACISPNNTTKGKPGDWVGKHGFTPDNCAAFALQNLGSVPSGNSPDSFVQ